MNEKELREISQEELQQILELHKQWIKSNEAEGTRADLQGADLRIADLQGADLQGADLQGADLRIANLQGANLQEANLQKANLGGANLQKANLGGANLQKANLQEADLTIAYFKNVDVKNIDSRFPIPWIPQLEGIKSNLQEANLRGANLQEANLRGANLQEANLQEANLQKANLQKANLQEANLTSITIHYANLGNISEYIFEKYGNTFNILGLPSIPYIIRSIEFPPEYKQAGMSILNYFGEVLNQRYPDKKTKVKIEQEGLKVTMVIETEEGDKEEIEGFLDQYGMVVRGEMKPEELFDGNKLQVIEFNQKLELAKLEIRNKQELLDFAKTDLDKKNVQIAKLLNIIGDSVQKSSSIVVNTSSQSNPVITSSQTQTFHLENNLPQLQSGLNELKEEVAEEYKEEIEALKESLRNLEKHQNQQEIKESSAMSKLKRFLKDVEDSQKTAGKMIQGVKDGVSIAQELAEYYNDIAQWCGLPVVPKPFLKKKNGTT